MAWVVILVAPMAAVALPPNREQGAVIFTMKNQIKHDLTKLMGRCKDVTSDHLAGIQEHVGLTKVWEYLGVLERVCRAALKMKRFVATVSSDTLEETLDDLRPTAVVPFRPRQLPEVIGQGVQAMVEFKAQLSFFCFLQFCYVGHLLVILDFFAILHFRHFW